jgi:predicted secreted hydrolase
MKLLQNKSFSRKNNPPDVSISSAVEELHCHESAQTEWWHYNGHLKSETGSRRFGFQLTFFRRRTDGRNHRHIPFTWPNCPTLFFAHFAVSDLTAAAFHHSHRRAISNGCMSVNHYRLRLGDWSVEERNGIHFLNAKMRGADLQIQLEPKKPGVMREGSGEFRRTGDQLATHLCFTRLATCGKLTLNGQTHKVSGAAWLDREFGQCDFCPQMGGWDWFAIQLDDDRELMIYQVCDEHRDYNGHRSLLLVDSAGQVQQLGRSDFNLRPSANWTSPWTNTVYPIVWQLEVPELHLNLKITPSLACQELDTRGSTNVVYWEGAADVCGHQRNRSVNGHAYAELVGYHLPDRRITRRFVGWLDLLKNEFHYWRFSGGRTFRDAKSSP